MSGDFTVVHLTAKGKVLDDGPIYSTSEAVAHDCFAYRTVENFRLLGEAMTSCQHSPPDCPSWCRAFHAGFAQLPGRLGGNWRVWTSLYPSKEWRGLAYAYQAAGAPEGDLSRRVWLYTWNGRFFSHTCGSSRTTRRSGQLAWSVWWAWLPSMYAAAIVPALPQGTAPISDSQFLSVFFPTMCLFWAFVHWMRWLGRRPK